MSPHELTNLLRVLDGRWNLDRASPIGIVEALSIQKFFQHSCLHLGVAIKHFVEGWNCCSHVALLGDQEEFVVFWDKLGVDDGACIWIAVFVLVGWEEFLSWLFVDYHKSQIDFGLDLFEGIDTLLNLELPYSFDLTGWASISKDNYLLRSGLVVLVILFGNSHHDLVIAVDCGGFTSLEPGIRVELGHILIHCCTEPNPLHPSCILCWVGVDSNKYCLMLFCYFRDWCPQDITYLGNHLEKNFCSYWWAFLVVEVVQHNLRQNLELSNTQLLNIFIIGFASSWQHNKEHIVGFLGAAVLYLPAECIHHITISDRVQCSLLNLDIHTEILRCLTDNILHIFCMEILEVNQTAIDAHTAVVDLFVEELEAWYLVLGDLIAASEFESRVAGFFGGDLCQIIWDCNSKVVLKLERADLLEILSELLSETHNPVHFFESLDIGEFGYFSSFSLVHIIRDTSQQAQLRNKENNFILFVSCLDQRLFLVLDGEPVLPLIVAWKSLLEFLHIELSSLSVKDNLINDPILWRSIVCHHCGPSESFLNLLSLLLLGRQMLVLMIHISDLLQHSLWVHNLRGRIHFQIQPSLQTAEVSSKTLIDEEVGIWHTLFSLRVKEFPWLSNFNKVEFPHGSPKIVVQKWKLGGLVFEVVGLEVDRLH